MVDLFTDMKHKKFIVSEEAKYPRPRVFSASLCRSLRSLQAGGLITKGPDTGAARGMPRWSLTPEGLDTARRIVRELRRQKEEINEYDSFYVL